LNARSPAVIRLALIGAGRWGRNYIRTIASLDDAALLGVASRNPETASLVPPECSVVGDWRRLIESAEIDGIIVASPPASHAEILIAAAEAGKSVLVEKPLVTAQSQLPAIVTASARTSTTIMVEHTHLFHPAFRALKAEAEKYGPLRAIRSSAGARGPYRDDVSVLWDWAPHDVALGLDLAPGPAEVLDALVVARLAIGKAVAERLHLRLKLAGGAEYRIVLSTLDDRHRWFAADFNDCTLIYSDQAAHPLRFFRHSGARVDEDGEALPVKPGLPLTVAVREFVSAIRACDPRRDSLALGCQVVDIIARCEEMNGA